VNVAVTAVSALNVTVHAFVPEHPPPDQPVNNELPSGVAVRVIDVPDARVALQFWPQDIPLTEFTVPAPAPLLATVRVGNDDPLPDNGTVRVGVVASEVISKLAVILPNEVGVNVI